MSHVTITGRVVEAPRFSSPDKDLPVRTTFEIEGLHSGARVSLHAADAMAERVVGTLVAGSVITATCWPEDRERRRILFVDSLTEHPRDAA